MTGQSFIEYLAVNGACLWLVNADSLTVDAPDSVLTLEMIAELKARKTELLRCLSRRCPFCKARGVQTTRTEREGLVYLDTNCLACGELIETFVPASQPGSIVTLEKVA